MKTLALVAAAVALCGGAYLAWDAANHARHAEPPPRRLPPAASKPPSAPPERQPRSLDQYPFMGRWSYYNDRGGATYWLNADGTFDEEKIVGGFVTRYALNTSTGSIDAHQELEASQSRTSVRWEADGEQIRFSDGRRWDWRLTKDWHWLTVTETWPTGRRPFTMRMSRVLK